MTTADEPLLDRARIQDLFRGLGERLQRRYAREGRIPFSTTPGGHRRFSIDEVQHALGATHTPASGLFTVPSSSRRRRRIRAVATTSTQVAAFLRQP